MGDSGHDLTPARRGHFREDQVNDGSADVGEGVAVEEEKGRPSVAGAEEFYGFIEGGDFGLSPPPLCFERCTALRILAVLRASSCARSSGVAGDKLPTPVFEKSGSGL